MSDLVWEKVLGPDNDETVRKTKTGKILMRKQTF